jgi:hypothetical protein
MFRQAVSRRAFPRFLQEPQTRLMPPQCRTPPGQKLGIRQALLPQLTTRLRFRCHSTYDDTSTAVRGYSSSWSPPDTSGVPFPHRSPRRSSANAACGGLKPPPNRRLRRAKPSSLAEHRIPLISPTFETPFLVRGTRGDTGLSEAAVIQVRRRYPLGVAVGVLAGGPAFFGEAVADPAGQGEVVDVGAPGGGPPADVVDLAVVGRCVTARLRAPSCFRLEGPDALPDAAVRFARESAAFGAITSDGFTARELTSLVGVKFAARQPHSHDGFWR